MRTRGRISTGARARARATRFTAEIRNGRIAQRRFSFFFFFLLSFFFFFFTVFGRVVGFTVTAVIVGARAERARKKRRAEIRRRAERDERAKGAGKNSLITIAIAQLSRATWRNLALIKYKTRVSHVDENIRVYKEINISRHGAASAAKIKSRHLAERRLYSRNEAGCSMQSQFSRNATCTDRINFSSHSSNRDFVRTIFRISIHRVRRN